MFNKENIQTFKHSSNKAIKKSLGQQGLSIIEVILAMAIFVIIASTAAAVVIHSFSANRLAEEEAKAALMASEGLEAARSIKNQDFANLVAGNYGLDSSQGFWQLEPTPTTGGKYQRIVTIDDVFRGEQGEIVVFGGTIDQQTKKISCQVSWQFSPFRQNTLMMSTYLTDWETIICFWLDGEVIGSGDTVVDSQHINAEARDVFVVNEYAYLGTDYALFSRPEFFIFDITTPSGELELVGSLNIDSTVNAVYVAGNFAYLATNKDDQELMVINISDPQNPQKVGYFNADPGSVLLADGMDVWVQDSKVYLSRRISLVGPEFYVLEVNTSDAYHVTFTELGSLNFNYSADGLFVDENYAYLATSDLNKEFQIVDISNPSSPQRVCWYDLEEDDWDAWANSVFIKENRAYVVTQKSGNNDEYYVLELHPPYDGCSGNPESFITKVASAKVDANVNDVFVYEGYVFLANEKGNEELKIASVEDPTNFLLNLNLHGKAYAVYVYGCLAYVATGNNDAELQVIQPK